MKRAAQGGRLAESRFIHFATHGLLESGASREPSLVLGRHAESDDDGLPELHEVTRLKLNADLVVLSACDTGRGRLYAGKDRTAWLDRSCTPARSRLCAACGASPTNRLQNSCKNSMRG